MQTNFGLSNRIKKHQRTFPNKARFYKKRKYINCQTNVLDLKDLFVIV